MLKATQKLDQLTITRFIAALSVVVDHSGRNLEIFRYFQMFIVGPTAVSYFFVLSGFVMAFVYYRPGVPFDFRNYWLARFSRIYPVYILAFALTCLHYPNMLSRAEPAEIWSHILLYQAWIPNYALLFNSAAWSLSVEVFFYLLLPFLILWAMSRPVKQVIWFSLGLWVISQFVHFLLTMHFASRTENWLPFFPLFHLNQFLLGLAGGIWYLANSARLVVSQSTNRIWLFIALGILLLILSLRAYLPAFPQSFSLDTGLLAPLFLLIILTLALDKSGLSNFLSHPGLVLLGNASYGIYILHIPIAWLLNWLLALLGIKLLPEAAFLIYVLTVIGSCILIFKYIERPAQNWLRTNPSTLMKILLDIVLMLAMIRLSFLLRAGTETSDILRTQYFALRAGAGVFFLALLAFRFYTTNSWRSLALAIFSGTLALSGLMYWSWAVDRIEVFPRSIFFIIPPLIFTAIYLSRPLLEFLKHRVWNESKLS
jgi:peptidoglycan/LPS O-acetylase OafA/YrhL